LQPYFSAGENSTEQLLHDKIMNTKHTVQKADKPALNKGAVICSACGAVNSIRWEKKSIDIDDKQGSYKDLTFDFCEECGNVTNVDLS